MCAVGLVKDFMKMNRISYSILIIQKLLSYVTFIFGYEVFIRKWFLNSYIINGLILYLFLFKESFFSPLPELLHIVGMYNDSYTFLMAYYL